MNLQTGYAKIPSQKRQLFLIASIAAAVLFLAGFATLLVLQRSSMPQSAVRQGIGQLTADYELVYKPNPLYTQPKPAQKEARLLAYVDKVKFKLSYLLQGFEGVPADFVYSVDSRLVAHASETGKYIDQDYVVWQKDETPIPSTKVSSDGSRNSLDQSVDIDINKAIAFCKSIYDQTQVRTANELQLVFHVQATVHGSIGDTVDNNTVELVIPMDDSYLMVTGTPTAQNKLELHTAPPKPGVDLTLWIALCGLCALAAAAFAVWTLLAGKQTIQSKDPYTRQLTRIFKQYGERLVKLDKPLPYQQLATIPIDGIQEIIKIADEISQPVFYYRANQQEEKKLEFYVFDTGRIYYMVIFGELLPGPGGEQL